MNYGISVRDTTDQNSFVIYLGPGLAGTFTKVINIIGTTSGSATQGQTQFQITTDSISTTTGAVVMTGGVGIAKSLFVGANINVGGLTATRLVATNGSKLLESVTISNSNGCNTSFTGSTLTTSMTQDLSSSGNPSFESLTLSNTSNQLTLGSGHVGIINLVTPDNTIQTYTIPDVANDAEFVMTQGAQTINDAKVFSNALSISQTFNQLILGTTRKVTITAPTPATTSRTHTIPDVGANANFIMSEGDQTLNGTKTFGSGILLPTSGGTPTAFDYYEEYDHVTTLAGPWTTNPSCTIRFVKIGKTVTLTSTADQYTASFSHPFIVRITSAFPEGFAPTNTIYASNVVMNAGVEFVYYFNVGVIPGTGGYLVFYGSAPAYVFTGGDCRVYTFTATYNLT